MLWTVLLSLLCLQCATSVRYDPTWESLDSRPLPAWYDEGKIGIFLHWGVFSVPSFGSEWFWYTWKTQQLPAYVLFMQNNYRPGFTYADFAPMFKAEFFSPTQWAEIFEAAGANYVVLTSKHHEGFTNWPSDYSFNWNSGQIGPNRDLVGDLAAAIRSKTKLKFGVYHSMFEWYNPLYLQDAANNYQTQKFVDGKTLPELYELVNKYKPEIVWSDGEWMAPDWYWKSTEFIAWLYNDSPVKDTVVVNDRWGNNTRCKHGGFWDCEDHFTPGKPPKHKWENCMTVDKYSWGFRRNAKFTDIHSMEELIEQLVTTVSLGGNLLLNVGPTAYGEIAAIYEERLRQMGSWLKVNGEAIYKTHLWTHQNDSVTQNVWYTATGNGSDTVVYAIALQWPNDGQLNLGFATPTASTTVSLVGYAAKGFSFKPRPGGGMTIDLSNVPAQALPCQWGWAFKLTKLKNAETKLRYDQFAQNLVPIEMRKDKN